MADALESTTRPLEAMTVAPGWLGAASSQSADRGADRWRRILISTSSSLAARAVAMACNLLTIPVALHYLGTNQYGAWVTLTSSVNLLSCLDCGVGIGLQNRVAEMMGRDQLGEVARCIRSTLVVLALISAAIAVVLALAIFGTPFLAVIFAHMALPLSELRAVLAVVTGAFVLSLPLGLFSRTAIGLQQGWIANLAATLGTILTLAGVWIAATLRLDFTAFVAVSVVPLFGSQLACLYLLARRIPGGLPLFGSVSLREGARTLREGSRYMLPQIGGLVLTQSPLVLLGTLASPMSAATYAVFTRIGVPFQQLQQIFLSQVWPAITEAMHRGDTAWLHRTLRRLLRTNLLYGGFLLVVTAASIVVLFPWLTRASHLQPTLGLILLYAINTALMSVAQGIAYVGNGLSRVKYQNGFALISLVFAATVLPLAAQRWDTAGILVALAFLNGMVAIPLIYRDYASYWSRAPSTVPLSVHA